MPEAVTCWKDDAGQVHDSFEEAVIADIARVLGKIGNGENSLTPAIARMIVANRGAIMEMLELLPDQPLVGDASILREEALALAA